MKRVFPGAAPVRKDNPGIDINMTSAVATSIHAVSPVSVFGSDAAAAGAG